MAVTAKANGQTYSLQEELQTTAKTVSTNPALPPVQVIQYGKIALIRCSAYCKQTLTSGTQYSTDLGIGSVSQGSDYRLFPHGNQGWYTVHITREGLLEVTPSVNIAEGVGLNFSMVVILT